MIHLISHCLILIGSLFYLLSIIGIMRFKDIFQKLHASTKAGTLGNSLILIGIGLDIHSIHAITEILILIIFIALTNPITGQLLARLNYLSKQRRHKPSRLHTHQ